MCALPLIYPSLLKKGDTIGLAAPASPPDNPALIDEVIARLTTRGFKVRTGEHVRERTGYLAGSDEHRAADINALFADPEVKAIFALRGGYGSCRILPLLDYDIIRANPKILLGYSDITAMHLAILSRTGLITYHGSNASSAFSAENLAIDERMLIESDGGRRTPGGGQSVLFSRDTHPAIETLVPGEIKGPLLGGNFTCLLRLIGTPYAPDFRGAILFLEDTCEKAYRIDGMFTHLRLAGVLDQVAGLVLGQFDPPDVPDEQRRINECLHREAARLGVPAISHAPIGHFAGQIIVPQGAMAELDATRGVLSAG